MKKLQLLFAGTFMLLATYSNGQTFTQSHSTLSTPQLTSAGWGRTLELTSTASPATLVFSNANRAFFIGGLSNTGPSAYFGFLGNTLFNGTAAPTYAFSLVGFNTGIFSAGDARAHNNFYVLQSLAVGTHSTAPSATLDVFGDARIRELPTTEENFNIVTVDNDGYLYSAPQSTLSSGDLDWVVSGTTTTVPTSLSDDIKTNGLVGIGMDPVPTYTHSGGTFTNIRLSVNGSVLAAGGQFVTSDSRLKTNIEELDNSLFKINQINGYSYSFIENNEYGLNLPQHAQIGVLAQEIQSIFPEAVVQTEEGFLSVNYDMLVPVLIESVQELSKELDELKTNNSSKLLSVAENRNTINSIYPNPTSSSLSFDLNLENVQKSAVVLITDLTGKEVGKVELTERGSFSSQIDVSNYTNGIYIYNLIVDDKIIDSQKFVKSSAEKF